MCYAGFPDIVGFYDMLYGTAGVDYGGLCCLYFGASGVVGNGNPPYTVTDFIQIYAKFAGPPTPLTGITLTSGSTTVTATQQLVAGMSVGQLLVNLNSVVKDTLVASVNPIAGTFTMTNPALQNDTTVTVYESPVMPIVVILSYIYLATTSVMQTRYYESWPMAMALFIAHYCTLFMRTESGVPNITASQVASSGLAKGVIVSRSAGDVSARSQLILQSYEEFGAWGETQYGELFETLARATATGPIWVG